MTLPRLKYERDRIHNITDRDLWSSWLTGDPELKRIVQAGSSGRRSAYVQLAGYLRDNTRAEWKWVQEDAKRRTEAAGPRRRSAADDVLRGRIKGWHDRTIDFGKRIDFNANFGESGQYGFHYLSWLTPLIDRYVVGSSPRDRARCVDIVRQYYGQRNDIEWRIARLDPVYYELGARAKTNVLLPLFMALIHTGKPGARDVEIFVKLFLGFGRSLLRLQRTGYRRGNWQIVGSAALFRLGAVFRQFREAAKWRRRAWQMMSAHLKEDFFGDGGHKERCWSYGWMSLRGVIGLCEAAERSGFLDKRGRAKLLRLVRRAFRWFAVSTTPTGIMPAYGDGDLADAGPVMEVAERFLAEIPKADKSVLLKPSGYAIMRSGPPSPAYSAEAAASAAKAGRLRAAKPSVASAKEGGASPESYYMNINFGPSGGGHTHFDLLDFNIWAFGQPIIEEVGRFDSYDQPLNPFFRSPEGHNQIVIDHQPMLRHEHRGRDVFWYSDDTVDYFSAWHDAFGAVARIHRSVLFVKGEYWLVYDVIRPAKENIFTISSFLHSVRPFKVTGKGKAVVTGKAGAVVSFAFPDEIKRLETGVDVVGAEVTAGRIYPERHFLRARKWAPNGYQGNQRFCTLIYPYKGRPPKVSIRPIATKNRRPGVARSGRRRCPDDAAETFEIGTPVHRARIKMGITSARALPQITFLA